jgi:putative hydroxymethylpyrimidine transport system ATP-binding protein
LASTPSTSFDVDLRQATLSYAGAPLFERLDFTLHRGQCTCLLGPSGVGKSSLLRLIAGLVAPEAGEVACSDGQALAGRLVWMGQQDSLLPWLSVLENVMLGARLRGQRADRARAEALLARVGLERQQDQRPATLSGGQRQRAALARTLMEDRWC